MAAFPDEERRTRDPKGQVPGALVCLLVAIALLHLPGDTQDDISRMVRGTILQPFVVVQEYVAHARVRRAQVEDLRERNDSLTARTATLEGLMEENRRLRGLLDLRERAGTDFVPASVVRPGTRGAESIFLLDVGERDGVRVNAPVIAEDGLVGVVREVSSGSAVGMDWTHPDFRASVMVSGGELYGIIRPQRGPFRETDRLILDGLPYHADVEDSTRVVTSGLGGVYPRGLVVGRVQGVHEEGAGWRRSYRLTPAVEVASVTHVLVLTGEALPGGDGAGDDFTVLWEGGVAEALRPGTSGVRQERVSGLSEQLPEAEGPGGREAAELEGPPDPDAPPPVEETGAGGSAAGEGGFGLPPNPVGMSRAPGGAP